MQSSRQSSVSAGLVVTLLETAAERLLWTAKTDDERLAIEPAMLVASIRAMQRLNIGALVWGVVSSRRP